MGFKELKSQFLSVFRELFVYHHRSLEFRAKLFAAMIVAGEMNEVCEYDVLKDIATQIYGEDEYRVEVMVRTTKEFVNKIVKYKIVTLDELLLDIDRELKHHKRFIHKINLEHLKKFKCGHDDDSSIVQDRVLEFLEAELRCRGLLEKES